MTDQNSVTIPEIRAEWLEYVSKNPSVFRWGAGRGSKEGLVAPRRQIEWQNRADKPACTFKVAWESENKRWILYAFGKRGITARELVTTNIAVWKAFSFWRKSKKSSTESLAKEFLSRYQGLRIDDVQWMVKKFELLSRDDVQAMEHELRKMPAYKTPKKFDLATNPITPTHLKRPDSVQKPSLGHTSENRKRPAPGASPILKEVDAKIEPVVKPVASKSENHDDAGSKEYDSQVERASAEKSDEEDASADDEDVDYGYDQTNKSAKWRSIPDFPLPAGAKQICVGEEAWPEGFNVSTDSVKAYTIVDEDRTSNNRYFFYKPDSDWSEYYPASELESAQEPEPKRTRLRGTGRLFPPNTSYKEIQRATKITGIINARWG